MGDGATCRNNTVGKLGNVLKIGWMYSYLISQWMAEERTDPEQGAMEQTDWRNVHY